MEIIILGSAGCTTIPRPTCQCKICKEAREKGIPYSRSGSSIFLKEINAIFDTPEEIKNQLNRENILKVDNIFYTHWHPDHTLGLRVIEEMNLYWLAEYIENKKPEKKVNVYALPDVMKDLLAIRNRFSPYLEYYKKKELVNLVELKNKQGIVRKRIKITPILVKPTPLENSTVYVLEHNDKKLIYAPCDVKPFPESELLKNAEILIIGGVVPDEPLKDNYFIPEENPLKAELYSIKDLIRIKERLRIRNLIITHIEEEWGKSFDDYKKLEQKYKKHDIRFAFDGMKIKL